MFHEGTRTNGGDLESSIGSSIHTLLTEFANKCQQMINNQKIRRGTVRCLLPASILMIVDKDNLWIAAQKVFGMPSTIGVDKRDCAFSLQDVYNAARWDIGFDDPYVIQFPVALIDQTTSERANAVEAIARQHVSSELQRVQIQMNMVQINPLFGAPAFAVDPKLAFVLMPFKEDLTKIYNTLIKPTVENPDFGLVCKRADDIKSNKVIMQDIWKSIPDPT
jgi:hypothetical protein